MSGRIEAAITGSRWADGGRLMRAGLRNLDIKTCQAGYQVVKGVIGKERARDEAFLTFADWIEEDVGLENTSRLYQGNVAIIRILLGRR